MQRFCFRFDVDGENCIRNGVPKLLALGEETGIKFTFFVNMGRSVDRIAYVSKVLRGRSGKNAQGEGVTKLPNAEKLGKMNFLKVGLLNPKAGDANRHLVSAIAEAGHEVGLHGGRNHGNWMHSARRWGREKINSELEWGANAVEEAAGKKAFGFSAPGFVTSKSICEALKANKFEYCSDSFGDGEKIGKLFGVMPNLPVNIVGNGGVGFVETMRAQGKKDGEIVREFGKKLAGKEFAIAYDHPGYAAVKEIELVGKLVDAAEKNGFRVGTMHEIAKEHIV